MADKLTIVRGDTLRQPVRWGAPPFIYVPITAVVGLAPLCFTAPAHGMPDQWRVEALSLNGMVEINSSEKEKPSDYHLGTVVDSDTVEFNEVNATNFSQYVNGGHLRFKTPVDLTGYTGVFTIYDKVGGAVLLTLTSENGGVEIDNAGKAIYINMTDEETDALTFSKGVCSLVMVSSTGVATKVFTAPVVVTYEVAS